MLKTIGRRDGARGDVRSDELPVRVDAHDRVLFRPADADQHLRNGPPELLVFVRRSLWSRPVSLSSPRSTGARETLVGIAAPSSLTMLSLPAVSTQVTT